jgi:preprotein translocase subunit SecG
MHELLFTTAIAITSLFGIAGGGGSSSGGGGGGGFSGGSSSGGYSGSSGGSDVPTPFVLLIVGTIIIFVIISVVISNRTKAKIKAKSERVKSELLAASSTDTLWDEAGLKSFAQTTFLNHQRDWSAFAIDSMKSYMTPAYFMHTSYMMAALRLMQRQNKVENVSITAIDIAGFEDNINNTLDHFEATMTARVDDSICDTLTGEVLHTQVIVATQTYKFVRSGDTWLFAGIDQSTASTSLLNDGIQAFAAQNGLFYSPDWGWLLLPRRGQLFDRGTFGTSDINNHVIGMHSDILIQLYTYSALPGSSTSYIIAQTSVPKRYGDIVVRRKNSGMSGPTKGLNKLSTEWGEFNKKYDVFASDTEQATSFELLHPTFMEVLEALPFEVSIEVVDNVVYLYTVEVSTATDNNSRYEVLLDVLKRAFKEMRM